MIRFFGNNFRSALFTWTEMGKNLRLGYTKPPPAGFGGSMRRSHAIAKKHAFLYVFSRPAKYQNDVIFVNIEGLRSCLSKPSYRAPKWALMVRLMQQERRKSPQKSIFQKTGPFGDVTETAILAILASHFRDRVDTPKKIPLGVLLKSARPS